MTDHARLIRKAIDATKDYLDMGDLELADETLTIARALEAYSERRPKTRDDHRPSERPLRLVQGES